VNVLCSFLTIYALLCSNVVVHLSDHNRVMVAQVDYHTKSDKEAARWWRMAASQGNVDAQCQLGFVFKNGEGVAQNDVEAARWLRKAAEQGNARAQCGLGFLYLEGHGVPKDIELAIQWIIDAADQGHTDALELMEFLHDRGPAAMTKKMQSPS